MAKEKAIARSFHRSKALTLSDINTGRQRRSLWCALRAEFKCDDPSLDQIVTLTRLDVQRLPGVGKRAADDLEAALGTTGRALKGRPLVSED